MIVIKLQGGLGNQMFQYATAKILAKKNKKTLKIDTSFFDLKIKKEGFTPRDFELSIFKNKEKIANLKDINYYKKLSQFNSIKKRIGFKYPKVLIEPSLGYHKEIIESKGSFYLEGYFQSYLYFKGSESFVKSLFSFPLNQLDFKNKELLQYIKNTETVAVHIRRGDYINDKHTQQFHGNCGKDYYLKAINKLEEYKENLTYVFFSDDIEWVKEEFKDEVIAKIFVDENKGNDSWKDMLLMSSCQHQIIANSSFSWWGAWLNSNPKKIVIAPKKWFNDEKYNNEDLLPTEWIKI